MLVQACRQRFLNKTCCSARTKGPQVTTLAYSRLRTKIRGPSFRIMPQRTLKCGFEDQAHQIRAPLAEGKRDKLCLPQLPRLCQGSRDKLGLPRLPPLRPSRAEGEINMLTFRTQCFISCFCANKYLTFNPYSNKLNEPLFCDI